MEMRSSLAASFFDPSRHIVLYNVFLELSVTSPSLFRHFFDETA